VKNEWCLDIKDGIYKIGDLNLMFHNDKIIEYPPIDVNNPKRPFYTGVIRQEVSVDGENRPFLVYIPKSFPISGAGVFLYPENGVTCEEFLENGGFKEIADQKNVALIVLQSRLGGWSRKDIQSEVTYSEQVFKKAISRVYFSLNEAAYYIMGIGTGAYVATTYGFLNSAVFSCILADGDYQLDARLLKQLGMICSDRDASESKLDVRMPAWMVDRTGNRADDTILKTLKRADTLKDAGLRNQYAAVYQQDMKRYYNSMDGLPMTEVWSTKAQEASEIPLDILYEQMITFALQFKRWMGIGNGDIRAARNYQDMNLKRYEARIDDRMREWYVYQPSAYQQEPERKLPVVLAIHGYSCTGEIFAESSSWHELAEKRDFFVIYVSAYPSNKYFGRGTVPLPTWNCIGMEAEADDLHYISEVLKDVKSRYPVDMERIYVTGHSNGSLMTQTLMAKMPLEFAAFAPQGAQFHVNPKNDPKADKRDIARDGILRPVWLMMGDEDVGVGSNLEPGLANDKFIQMMCRVDHLDRNKVQCLENGKYTTYTYTDEQKVPLLKFTGVKDFPHAYTPEICYLFWDQFFCHFRRKADGSVEYVE